MWIRSVILQTEAENSQKLSDMSDNVRLPEEFVKLMEASIGKEASDIFIERYNTSKAGVTSVRFNNSKLGGILPDIADAWNDADRVKWCSNGYYLHNRPVFTLDPLFHAGAYYVQEASSMFAEVAMQVISANSASVLAEKKLKVLDLCAAPGGKSTHIASLISDDSLLVSNEVIRSRAVVLADNMAKWGCENSVVTNNDPRDFKKLSGYFDIIFVDAPCSGEGMFIKEQQSINEWSVANVELCAARQKRILQDVWPALAPGGYLVYSTCTFNHFENDDNLQFVVEELGAETVCEESALDRVVGAKILRTKNGGYQFVPGMVEGEGQFFAVVRKYSDNASGTFAGGGYGEVASRRKKEKSGKSNRDASKNILKGFEYLPAAKYDFSQIGEIVKAYPKELSNEIRFVEGCLKIVSSGIAVATLKGKDYIPHPDFALQKTLAEMVAENRLPAVISAVEVDKETALKFLAKEPLVLPEASKGYVLLTYKGMGLGFLKNLGNRTNNLLPMARRIRMQNKIL